MKEEKRAEPASEEKTREGRRDRRGGERRKRGRETERHEKIR